jgi:hypothetical protein
MILDIGESSISQGRKYQPISWKIQNRVYSNNNIKFYDWKHLYEIFEG